MGGERKIELFAAYRIRRIACLLTTTGFVAGARVCKLNAVLVDAPADAHGLVALYGPVEARLIAVWRIRADQITAQPAADGGARSIRLLEAATPLAWVEHAVLVEITNFQVWPDAKLVLAEEKDED